MSAERAGAWLERHRTKLPQVAQLDQNELAHKRLLWAIDIFLEIMLEKKTGDVVYKFRDGIPAAVRPGFEQYPPK